MKNILAFGASNSKKSINQEFAVWVANQLEDVKVNHVHISDFEAPIYSIDRETENGIPKEITEFRAQILKADAIIISLAEHNGNFTTAFKNLYDWLTRVDRKVWNNLPVFLLGATPSPGGAKNVLALAQKGFAFAGGIIEASFSLPTYSLNFNANSGFLNGEILKEFESQLALFNTKINTPELA